MFSRPWCWERLKAGREGDDRGCDGWMASPTQWRWVWVNSGSWWWTGRPGGLWFMVLQRVRHDWVTELNWTEEAAPHLLKFCHEIAAIPSHLRDPFLALLLFLNLQFTLSTAVLDSSELSMSVGTTFFQTPVNVDILISSYEWWLFSMTFRMVNPF